MAKKLTSTREPLPGLRVRVSTKTPKAVAKLRESEIVLEEDEWSQFFKEFQAETDRGAVILAAAWIDELLGRKLKLIYSKGNQKDRDNLFESNGPFHGFGAKITVCTCMGLLDADLAHDVGIIKKIRNKFAHQIHGLSLMSPEISQEVERFKIPHRVHYDWNQLRASATQDGKGFVLYTGDKPKGTGEGLSVSTLKFRIASAQIITYLSANLGVHFCAPDEPDPAKK